MLSIDQNSYCSADGTSYHSEPSDGRCGSVISGLRCAFAASAAGGCARDVPSKNAPCVPHARDDDRCIVWIRDTPSEPPTADPNPL